MEQQDHKAQLDLKDQQALRVNKALLEKPDQKDPLEIKDQQGSKALLV